METTAVKSPVMHMLHALEVEPGDIGVTVRLGDKWVSKAPVGTEIVLCVCKDRCLNSQTCDDTFHAPCAVCTRQGLGVVSDSWYGPFYDVPARFLEHEHELRSRAYSGLVDSMTKAYGESFGTDSMVAVVGYTRVG